MKQLTYLLVVCFLFAGCASHITVVDPDGAPIPNALVFSEKQGFLFSPMKVGITQTDQDGRAQVVSRVGHIVKPGYHTIINSSDINTDLTWGRTTPLIGEVALYPVLKPGTPTVNVETLRLVSSEWPHFQTFKTDVCPDVEFRYGLRESSIHATSLNDTPLFGSERFYFMKGGSGHPRGILSGKEHLALYCRSERGMNKVGVYVQMRASVDNKKIHVLTLLSTENISLRSYIEPKRRCLKELDVFMADYVTSESDLVLTSGWESGFETIIATEQCNSEYIRAIGDRLQGYMD